MVLAAKRAVGAEYIYPQPSRQTRESIQTRKYKSQRFSVVHTLVTGTVMISLIFALGLSFIFLKAYQAELNYKSELMKQGIHALQTQNVKLEVEIARLQSLNRIEAVAMTELGMIKNPVIEYISLQGIQPLSLSPEGTNTQDHYRVAANEKEGPLREGLLGRITRMVASKNKLARG